MIFVVGKSALWIEHFLGFLDNEESLIFLFEVHYAWMAFFHLKNYAQILIAEAVKTVSVHGIEELAFDIHWMEVLSKMNDIFIILKYALNLDSPDLLIELDASLAIFPFGFPIVVALNFLFFSVRRAQFLRVD